MNKRFAPIILLAMVAFWASVSEAGADDAAAPQQPWQKAQSLLVALEADFDAKGIMAVGPRVADLEQALVGAKTFYASETEGGTSYVLTDGSADTLMALMLAANEGKGNVTAVANPYPSISIYLGSYYNETGKYQDAFRVLDAGLALAGTGEHRPLLLTERGAALIALKRWSDALASYDAGLAIDDAVPALRAKLFRGRGFALTELNRLDEAEKAYRDSLAIEPGNARAQSELNYIAGLRAGEKPTSTGITPLQPLSKPVTDPTPQN